MRIRIAPYVLAVAASGCIAYQPRPLDPVEEMRALRQPAGAPPALTAREGFGESEVVAVALALNPDLRLSRLRLGEPQAAVISAGLWPNPELGVGLRGGVFGASGYVLESELALELLRPGQREARRAAADHQLEESRLEVAAQEWRVAVEARQRLLAVLAAQEALSLLIQEADLRQRTAELVRRRRLNGEATELELSAAQLEAAEGRSQRRWAEAEVQAARRELNRVMGLPPPYPLRLRGWGEKPSVPELADHDVDQRLLERRAEVRAAQAAYRRAEEELRLAVMQQYPRLKLGPGLSVEPEGGHYLGLSAGIELPLLDRGQGRIAEASARREASRGQFVAMLHRLRAEAFEARDRLGVAAAEVKRQEQEILPLVQRLEQLYETAQRAGEISVLDWISARQRSLKARRELLETTVRYRRHYTELEAAVGSLRESAGPVGRAAGPSADPRGTVPSNIESERNEP